MNFEECLQSIWLSVVVIACQSDSEFVQLPVEGTGRITLQIKQELDLAD